MKKLLLAVSCINEHTSARAESFYIEVNDGLANRIKQLSKAVTDMGVYSIEEFYRDGEWSNAYVDPSDINEDNSNIDEIIADLKSEETTVELQMLRVTSDEFQFISNIKDAGDDGGLSTKRIDVEKLLTSDIYIDLN